MQRDCIRLDAENYVVSISKTKLDRAMVTTKREYEVTGYLSFAVVVEIA